MLPIIFRNCPELGSTCTNTDGSYTCECNDGFTAIIIGGRIERCADVNECQVDLSRCGPNAICSNTFGGYTCTCLAGYEKKNELDATFADDPCGDIDECARGTHVCDVQFPLDCVNIEGTVYYRKSNKYIDLIPTLAGGLCEDDRR